jgi:fructose-1,6-bisphosphatase/sedoheptulose 1,7-bisphosphatase-like protein
MTVSSTTRRRAVRADVTVRSFGSTPVCAAPGSQVLTIDDLVRGDNVFFAATGVTDGEHLRGVRFRAHEVLTQSLSKRSVSGAVRLIDARHQLDRSNLVTRPRS